MHLWTDFVCRKPDPVAETSAERLDITTRRSSAEALDVIVHERAHRSSGPPLLRRSRP